jgi:hypothetical protein
VLHFACALCAVTRNRAEPAPNGCGNFVSQRTKLLKRAKAFNVRAHAVRRVRVDEERRTVFDKSVCDKLILRERTRDVNRDEQRRKAEER